MDILEEEIPVINARFTEEDEDLILSKSGSLFGSRDELHSLSRTRSEDDLRSDDDEVRDQVYMICSYMLPLGILSDFQKAKL